MRTIEAGQLWYHPVANELYPVMCTAGPSCAFVAYPGVKDWQICGQGFLRCCVYIGRWD